jgi:type II secretory pathway component PulK
MRLHRKNRGFAIIIAIFMIAFVGITVAIIGDDFYRQSRRSTLAEDDAQLRQLLIAGQEILHSRLSASKTPDDPIPLPQILTDRQAHLAIQSASSDSSSTHTFTISAALPHRTISQRVSYSLDNSKWILTSAELSD